MPTPYAPVYDEWVDVITPFVHDNVKVIVAHSAGCGFLLKWLSAHKDIALDALVLVAPYTDPFGKYGDFLSGEWDENLMSRIGGMHLLYADNEFVPGVKESVDAILDMYPSADLHRFEQGGHFIESYMESNEFDDLWDIIKLIL